MGLEGRTLLAIDFASATGLNLNLPVNNSTLHPDWYQINNPTSLNPTPLSVKVDTQVVNNVSHTYTYIAGQFYGTTNFDTKNHSNAGQVSATGDTGNSQYPSPDFFVAKYDTDGTLLWVKTGGGLSADSVYGLAVDSGNVYISGSYASTQANLTGLLAQANFPGSGPIDPNTGKPDGNATDGFVMKLDASSGALVWGQDIRSTTAGRTDQPMGITTDNSGNVYITGAFNGDTTFPGRQTMTVPEDSFGNPLIETYVAKFASSGSVAWVSQFSVSTPGRIQGQSIAVDSQGNVITVGSMYGQADLNPAQGQQNLVKSNGFDQGNSVMDGYVSKLNNAGDYVFGATFGGTDYDAAQSVAVDSQNNIFISGIYTAYKQVNSDGSSQVVWRRPRPQPQRHSPSVRGRGLDGPDAGQHHSQ